MVNAISQAGKQIDEEKKKKQEEDFYNSVANLYSQWKQKQNTISNSGPYQLQGEVNNVFAPGNFSAGERLGTNLGGFNGTVDTTKFNTPETNTPPPIQTKMISPEEKYGNAEANLNTLQNAIAPLLLNRNVNEKEIGKANILSQLAQSQVERSKPKEKQFFNLGKNQKRFSYNPNNGKTKEVASNIVEQLKDNPLDKKIDEYVNTKNQKVLIFQKPNGETYEKPYGRVRETKKGSSNKEPKDKTLKPSTAKLIADLKNFQPFTVNDLGVKNPMSPDDIKYAKDNTLENIKLQLLSPRAYEFINNIEDLWREGDKTGSRQYLSPKELYNETLKHAKNGELDEKVQDEIANYLKYYSTDIYKGLTKKYEQNTPSSPPKGK